jgi:hypothetical protein
VWANGDQKVQLGLEERNLATVQPLDHAWVVSEADDKVTKVHETGTGGQGHTAQSIMATRINQPP